MGVKEEAYPNRTRRAEYLVGTAFVPPDLLRFAGVPPLACRSFKL
jgi:hypothetical protein